MLNKYNNVGAYTSVTSLVAFSLIYIIVSIVGISNWTTLKASTQNHVSDIPVIIIDPGHGGDDGGALGFHGEKEKDINLSVSRFIHQFCGISGVDSVLTRNDDYMLDAKKNHSLSKKRSDLIARTEIASDFDNAVFVSIHQNKFDNGRYKGLQVFYSKNDPRSASLATIIKDMNIRLIDKNNKRETKPGGREIYVLDNINCPAVLIECGFLSNAEEAAKLNTVSYQKELAFMIYSSLMEFIYDN